MEMLFFLSGKPKSPVLLSVSVQLECNGFGNDGMKSDCNDAAGARVTEGGRTDGFECYVEEKNNANECAALREDTDPKPRK